MHYNHNIEDNYEENQADGNEPGEEGENNDDSEDEMSSDDRFDPEIDELRALFQGSGFDDHPQEFDKQMYSKIDHSKTKIYPGAGQTYGKGTTFFEQFAQDRFSRERNMSNNVYYPFASFEEWEFTNVFMRLQCSLAQKTELLNTKLVSV